MRLSSVQKHEWKEVWKTRIDSDDKERETGDFCDYLYDFHSEMLM